MNHDQDWVRQKWAIRQDILLNTLDSVRPDVFIVEFFPFGRHAFAPELVPLISKAKAFNTLIVSSVRDIVCSFPSAKQQARAVTLLNELFDAVLIHGDPRFAEFTDYFNITWPPNIRRFYTGFVASAPKMHKEPALNPRILCTAGGGKTGFALCSAAEGPRF
jgi:predicted glycosyltransferase